MPSNREEVYHSLSVMINSGLPLQKALEMASALGKGRLGRGFRGLADAAATGVPMARAMAARPDTFSRLEVLVVEAAETSGRLGDSLERLSKYYGFISRLRATALSGLALPVILLHAAAFVIPAPQLLFGSIDLGGYFLRVLVPLLFLYVPAAAVVGIVRYAPETGPLRAMLDGLTVRVPILGKAARQLALSRFSRTFQMLYACGTVPIAECVRKSAEVAGNTTVRRWLEGGIASAEAGHPVSEGFSPRLPRAFAETWRIGEEAGKLDETAIRLADNAAEDSERLFQNLAVWLPRVVYILVSIFIIINIFRGFFAIYGPVFDELNK